MLLIAGGNGNIIGYQGDVVRRAIIVMLLILPFAAAISAGFVLHDILNNGGFTLTLRELKVHFIDVGQGDSSLIDFD